MKFLKKFTKKQKIASFAIFSTAASLAFGSFFIKKKVQKMKEEGTLDRISFTKYVNKYLKAAKKDMLTLDIINSVLEQFDKASQANIDLNLDTDKYLELQEYLDDYFDKITSTNHVSVSACEENTEERFKKCLNMQKFILERF